MKHKRILVVSTYPRREPRHGGQKRLQAIFEAYQHRFEDVKSCAVFYGGFYSTYGPDDIPLGTYGEQQIMQSPLTDDLTCGQAIYDDPTVKAKFKRLLLDFKPQIIHMEQPATYLGLKPLLHELGLRPKLIFGSQNIEAPMKGEILTNAGVPRAEAATVEKRLDELERSLSRECDLLVACTERDRTIHAGWGATNTVLAPNGIAKSQTTPTAVTHWKSQFQRQDIQHQALYIASGHPPNWTGFLQVVGKGLGFLPYDSRLVIAGSVCDYFQQQIRPDSQDVADVTFWLRAISAGRVSESSLGALLSLCEVIILPITEGGGSNLKTAEAILADKKVVTTSHGLRSFEWFTSFPNVWVADTAPAFRKAMATALSTEYQPRTAAQQKQATLVEWSNCLAELTKKVAEL